MISYVLCHDGGSVRFVPSSRGPLFVAHDHYAVGRWWWLTQLEPEMTRNSRSCAARIYFFAFNTALRRDVQFIFKPIHNSVATGPRLLCSICWRLDDGARLFLMSLRSSL